MGFIIGGHSYHINMKTLESLWSLMLVPVIAAVSTYIGAVQGGKTGARVAAAETRARLEEEINLKKRGLLIRFRLELQYAMAGMERLWELNADIGPDECPVVLGNPIYIGQCFADSSSMLAEVLGPELYTEFFDVHLRLSVVERARVEMIEACREGLNEVDMPEDWRCQAFTSCVLEKGGLFAEVQELNQSLQARIENT